LLGRAKYPRGILFRASFPFWERKSKAHPFAALRQVPTTEEIWNFKFEI
jgi:hypothetical protein